MVVVAVDGRVGRVVLGQEVKLSADHLLQYRKVQCHNLQIESVRMVRLIRFRPNYLSKLKSFHNAPIFRPMTIFVRIC